jgi:2-polyprenyl-3-methyl-5-hydroxy-6-metoxy-1,4-benzoquinol methylase
MEKAENLKKLILEEEFKQILKPKKKELDMKNLIDNLPDDVEETYKPSAMREYVDSLSYTKTTGIKSEGATLEEQAKHTNWEEPNTEHIGQTIVNLLVGQKWDDLMGLYGIDFRNYFVMDKFNKVKDFRIKDFNNRILEIEKEKRWFAQYIHDKLCEMKGIDSLKECNGIEIGSGTGIMAEWMAGRVKHLTCADIDEELIGYCIGAHKEFKNISHHLIKKSLDFSMHNNIDFVYAQSVFIHLGVIDFYAYLKELKNSLNKGGLIYIDIIDGDLDVFNFEEAEMKRQALALKTFYGGTGYLFTVNSTACLAKVAKELGYELISVDNMNKELPNTHLIFKKL